MLPSIPSLRFDNRLEVDALQFDTLDQNGVAFHVVVAKTAYALGPRGTDGLADLVPLDEPREIYPEDRYHDDDIERSVRLESDLAPYKPLCDVVVVGAAHPPAGRSVRRFNVSLRVQAPDRPALAPARPQPLNPMQDLSTPVYEEWQRALAQARATRLAGEVLVDKTLVVTGERSLRRHPSPLRALQMGVALATLGLVRPNPYRLTRAAPAQPQPLRYEYAQGGQCRIEAADPAAGRVAKRQRLSAAQAAQYPDGAPAAHASCQHNPVGCGFARPWYLGATRTRTLPAPRIEYAEAPFTARRFWRAARGKATLVPAGFGFVGRGWLPRRTLAGTFEDKAAWAEDEVPQLPKDFDFRYWNGAPEDQQCRHLEGGERFTLTNLCPPSAAFAHVGENGDTLLSFILPRQTLFLLGADEHGAVAAMPLAIDTVLVDLDAGVVELVWRRCLVADGGFEEVRLLQASTDEQLARLREWNTPPSDTAAAQPAVQTSVEAS